MNIIDIYPEKSKILLVGPYPPPYGGVSVYIKRLKSQMVKAGYKTSTFYKSRKYNNILLNALILFRNLIYEDFSIVHIHGYFRAYVLVILFARCFKRYSMYYTIHNSRLLKNKSGLATYFIKKFIEKTDCLILVTKGLIDNLQKNNINLPKKYYVCNAFLPPPEEDEPIIYKTYSSKTMEFISIRKPLIIANASRISFYNKIDLYGLDTCIELSAKLKKDYPRFGLLFSLADENTNKDYINKMKQRINKLNIEENILLMTGQKELWPLYKRADLSIRPTATDGDAVSIREALYFGTTIIASDVVPRPKETILYKSRDIEDLYRKVVRTIEGKDKCKQ
jgi:glycosyltransferase involved in cell wall biosynthesis